MAVRVTIADVAARAGVHKGTVSRALNADTEQLVNPVTLRRIQEAARELGYVPNVVARGLRRSASMTIGVLLPDLTNPVFPPIVRGIESYLSPRGYTALVANTDGRDSLERAAYTSLVQRRVDGLVIATARVDHPLLREAYEREVHAVMVQRASPGLAYPAVLGDDVGGVAESVAHLAALGHRSILHLAGPGEFTTSRARSDAFTAACVARGIASRVVQSPALSVAAGEALVREAIAREAIAQDQGATAIVAANDLLALGALRALSSQGLRCPQDVSVVGFNDIAFAEDFRTPLTTVHVPFHEMGVQAARLLLEGIVAERLDGETVRLPASLVVRASSGPPPAGRA